MAALRSHSPCLSHTTTIHRSLYQPQISTLTSLTIFNFTQITLPTSKMSQPLSHSEIDAAIAKYGPTLQLHPDEQYMDCSVEWMLSHSTLINVKDKTKNILHPTQDQLPQGPKLATQYYLQVEMPPSQATSPPQRPMSMLFGRKE